VTRIPDPNLKLTLLQALRDLELLPEFDKEAFFRDVLHKEYDEFAAYNERLDKRVLRALLATKLPDTLLAKIEQLVWDAGNDVHHDVWTNWDGEDETFDVRDLTGLEACTGLKSITFIAGSQVSDWSPVAGLPRLQQIYASGARARSLSPFLELPALKQLSVRFVDSPENRAVLEKLRARGIEFEDPDAPAPQSQQPPDPAPAPPSAPPPVVRMPSAREKELLAAVVASPDDDAPRLAYADFLAANGSPERAEFIRLQCEEARLEPGPKRNELYARSSKLLKGNEHAWSGLPEALMEARSLSYRRGFVEEIYDPRNPHEFFQRGAELLGMAPIRSVYFGFGGSSHSDSLARLPEFRRLRAFRVFHAGVAWLERFLASEHLGQLEELSLDACSLSGAGLEKLARSTSLTALKRLGLSNNHLRPEDAAVLAAAPLLGQLRELRLPQNPLQPEGIQFLADSEHVGQLQRLELHFCKVGAPGVKALARSPRLAELENLDIGFNSVGKTGVEALTKSKHLPKLTTLGLADSRLDAKAIEALARSPLASRLVHLNLQQNKLGDAAVRAFLEPESWGRLRSLNLFKAGISKKGMERLRERFGTSVRD
jgi:uncharacterized protein (TIGR02996 family)